MKQSILRKTKNRIFHYSHASLWSPARSPAGGFAFFILAAPEAIAVDPIAEFAAFRHKHTPAARFSTRDIIHVQPAISTCRDTVVLFSVSAGPVIIYNQAPGFSTVRKNSVSFPRARIFRPKKFYPQPRKNVHLALFYFIFIFFFRCARIYRRSGGIVFDARQFRDQALFYLLQIYCTWRGIVLWIWLYPCILYAETRLSGHV